jgi:hypothetical protein
MNVTETTGAIPITGLCSGLIPREEFPARQWFYATPLWYYHRPSRQMPTRLGPDFYKLVDRELKPLCLLLHSHGLQTTPSCQGHFYPKGHFQKVWNTIRRECELIHGPGLRVCDAETGRFYLFQDRDYSLPWAEFSAFHNDALGERGQGYLGIWAPDRFIDALLANKAPHPCIRFHTARHAGHSLALLTILVSAQSPAERTLAWSWLTHAIGSIV